MSHLFMPLLTELGGFGGGSCYKHVAPNGAFNLRCLPAFQQCYWRSVFRRFVIPSEVACHAVALCEGWKESRYVSLSFRHGMSRLRST
jgi:hypothetical protein